MVIIATPGAGRVSNASGAKTDRAELRKVVTRLGEGDVRSAQHAARDHQARRRLQVAGRHLWADTTTQRGRLMLTVLGGRSGPRLKPQQPQAASGVLWTVGHGTEP